MHCNRCGQENPDDAPTCLACGHKLQSGFRPVDEGGQPDSEPVPPLRALGPKARRRLRRHLEAWTVAILALAAAWGLLSAGATWAFYPLAVLAGGYAWMRGITWRD